MASSLLGCVGRRLRSLGWLGLEPRKLQAGAPWSAAFATWGGLRVSLHGDQAPLASFDERSASGGRYVFAVLVVALGQPLLPGCASLGVLDSVDHFSPPRLS